MKTTICPRCGTRHFGWSPRLICTCGWTTEPARRLPQPDGTKSDRKAA